MIVYILIAALVAAAVAATITVVIMRARNQAQSAGYRARLEEKEHQIKQLHAMVDPGSGALTQMLKELLGSDFEKLAGRIIDEKSRLFSTQSSQSLKELLEPFRQQVESFAKDQRAAREKAIGEHQQLLDQLVHTQSLNKKLSSDAENLAAALRGDSKTQGAWGELTLMRILEESGLQKGREYELQVHINANLDGELRRLRPDAIIHLPENRDIIIDAKVSLTAYSELIGAASNEERAPALQRHVESIRKHIKELGSREYWRYLSEKQPHKATPEYVFMYIPIDGAWYDAVREESNLQSLALQKRVLLVTPTTLLPYLMVIEKMWQGERQERNVQKMVQQAGGIHDKCVAFIESMQKMGNRLQQSRQEFDDAMRHLRSGRGNLISRAKKLHELGAPISKKLIENRVDDTEHSEAEDE